MIDYKRIRDEVPMERLCSLIGIPVKHGFAVCPLHHDNDASLKIYPGSKGYYCFGCHKGGDVIDFLAAITGQRKSDAARQLMQTFCIPESKAAASRRESILSRQKARENRLRMRDIANALAELYRAQNANMSRYAPSLQDVDKPWPEAFETACRLLPVIDCALTIADER